MGIFPTIELKKKISKLTIPFWRWLGIYMLNYQLYRTSLILVV